MDWFIVTIFAYFLLALEVIFDKFLLSSKRVSHPAIYTFYVGILGLFALIFAPFGFHLVKLENLIALIFFGAVFIWGMLSLFFALSKSEASRVTPVVGAVVPVVTFSLSFIFLGERLYYREIWGIVFLIIGGLSISYDLSSRKKFKLFNGFRWAVLSGTLLAISFTAFKGFYTHDNFFNVYIWTRIGAVLGAFCLLLIPQWRKIILSSLVKFKKPEKAHRQSGFIFIITRATGGLGSILKEKATSLVLASVTVVNAMVSAEYIFIFVIGLIFSIWLPKVFQEKKNWENITQKVLAIVIITLGIVLVSKHR